MADQSAQDRNRVPDSRAEFEAWAKQEGMPLDMDASHGVYKRSHTLDAWITWQAATQRQQERIAELERDLKFVERWANHHGAKPHTTAKEALSVIQHYPPIKRITRGYVDGVVPETFDPYARIAELEAQVQALSLDAGRWKTFISLPYAIRAEWACNLSLAPVLTQWIDQAAINAAVESRKDQS